MPYSTLRNQLNGRVALHVAGANSGDILVVGNTSQSNLAFGTETLSGASIRKMKWGTTGVITIQRGANVVWVATQSGEIEFDDISPVNLYPAANLVINVSTGNSAVMLEVSKLFGTMIQEF